MLFKTDKNTELFKNALVKHIQEFSQRMDVYQLELSDVDAQNIAREADAALSLSRIKQVIYDMEDYFGEAFKLRLQRKKSWGYVAMPAKEHSDSVHFTGGKKMLNTARRTSKRLNYVNIEALSKPEATTHVARKTGWDSLAGSLKLGFLKTDRLVANEVRQVDYSEEALLIASRVANSHSRKKD